MPPQYDYSKASLRRTPSGLDPEAYQTGSVPQAYHNDAFRILGIRPGAGEEDLRCILLVWSLRKEHDRSDKPEKSDKDKFDRPEKYDALSYNWGPQYGNKTITIEEERKHYYTLPVGPNLHAALLQLRDKHKLIYLWVDAICINQQDKDEKSVQIPLMKDIYNGAECVRVWLGAEGDGSVTAMDLINECLDGDRFDTLVIDVKASTRWAALLKLLRRPWFSRRWIIQEIALAKQAEVHCGDKNIGWDDFASVITRLRKRQKELRALFRESTSYQNHPDFIGNISNLGAMILADWRDTLLLKQSDHTIIGKSCDLETLVSSMTAFEASEPLDVIYAILWLAKDAHPYRGGRAGELNSSALSHSRSRASSVVGSEIEVNELQDDDRSQSRSPGLAKTVVSSTATKRRRSLSEPCDMSNILRQDESEVRPNPEVHLNGEQLSSPDDQPNTRTAASRSAGLPSAGGTDANGNLSNERGSTNGTSHWRGHKRAKLSISEAVSDQEKMAAAAGMLKTALKRGRITIDYDRTVLDLYKEFVAFVLSKSRSLDILCTPWAPPNVDLPTWIPQLSGTAFGATKSGVHRRIHADPMVKRPGASVTLLKPYNASENHKALGWCMGGDDGKSLMVAGFVLDEVADLEKPAVDGTIPESWMRAGGWTDQSSLPPDRFWRTLVGNLDADGQAAPPYWKKACKNAFEMRTSGGHLSTSSTSSILFECSSDVREYLERVQAVVWNRRLITMKRTGSNMDRSVDSALLPLDTRRTGDGVALAPDTTKRGDLICILLGCSVPVILRQFIDGKPSAKICPEKGCPSRHFFDPPNGRKIHYELIGECYVHGMMNGEGFKAVRENSPNEMIDEIQFELR